jgi:hypothetical protein
MRRHSSMRYGRIHTYNLYNDKLHRKCQTTNAKYQIKSKIQNSNYVRCERLILFDIGNLSLEIYLSFEIWILIDIWPDLTTV